VSLVTVLFGRRLANDEAHREDLGPLAGVPALGLDALASAAYGPEAALTVLLPVGALAADYVLPIGALVIGLLALIALSYGQTIAAYPGGGGAYTVAKENLGARAGLVAAAALLIDYMLNVAVAISAGIGALASAVPSLLPHTLPLCLGVLGVLVLANLRGPRSSGLAFVVPTYAFLLCLFVVVALGVARALAHGGHPAPVAAPPAPPTATEAATLWLVCRAFANGCTAMTGVEAVSNGVPSFRPPRASNARRTLAIVAACLCVLLAGVAFLAWAYGITATAPGRPGYQSVLSMIVAAVAGRGPFYYLSIGTVVAVLPFSANTSFAGFPRLCRILAADHYLPEPFELRGRRLAFTVGIGVLAACGGALLVAFRGLTEGLIPLFAVGALLAFTMSQAGMVAHWRRIQGPGRRWSLVLNATGATATAITLGIVLASKLREGAWISVLLFLVIVFALSRVHAHFRAIDTETCSVAPLDLTPRAPPIVVVPLRRWDRLGRAGLRFALTLSSDVYAVQVVTGDRDVDELAARWPALVDSPARASGIAPPKLVVLRSRYRTLLGPLVRFVHHLSDAQGGREVAVVVPQLVERRWYYWLLHNNTSSILRALLLLRGRTGLVLINKPFYMGDRDLADAA
jgi:amino acid transporter